MRPINILLVEDNKGDIRLVKEALKEARVINNLSIAMDGQDALTFLRKEGIHSEAPNIDLILLDLNLPKKSGIEVLQELKQDKNLKEVPVIILTTSDSFLDIKKAYSLGVNSYITKPVQLTDFIECMKAFGDFWLTFVKLPSRN